MRCPFCSHDGTRVLDKRANTSNQIRRRRACLGCDKRFTTYEEIKGSAITVLKSNGGREAFNREKLIAGITKACRKRPVSGQKIDYIADEIEKKLRRHKSGEVKSMVIGEEVMKHLMALDNVAYLRFASIYRDFKGVSEFKEEIKKL